MLKKLTSMTIAMLITGSAGATGDRPDWIDQEPIKTTVAIANDSIWGTYAPDYWAVCYQRDGIWTITLAIDTKIPDERGMDFDQALDIITEYGPLTVEPFGSLRATRIDEFYYADEAADIWQHIAYHKGRLRWSFFLETEDTKEYDYFEAMGNDPWIDAGRTLIDLGCRDRRLLAAMGKLGEPVDRFLESPVAEAKSKGFNNGWVFKIPRLRYQGNEYEIKLRLKGNGRYKFQTVRLLGSAND